MMRFGYLHAFVLIWTVVAGRMATAQTSAELRAKQNRRIFAQRIKSLEKREVTAMLGLAEKDLKAGLKGDAAALAEKIRKRDPENARLKRLLLRIEKSEERADAKARRKQAKACERLRRRFVKERHTLAQWCGKRGLDDERLAVLKGVLRCDPDDAPARQALGFEQHEGAWYAKEDIAYVRMGLRRLEGQTWISKDLAAGLGSGRFPFGDGVLDAAGIDRARKSWEQRWRLLTPHFSLDSNLPHQKVLELSRRLELARRASHKLFGLRTPSSRLAIFWSRTSKGMATLLEGVPLGDLVSYHRGNQLYAFGSPTPRAQQLLLGSLVAAQGDGRVRSRVEAKAGAWTLLGIGKLMERIEARGTDFVFAAHPRLAETRRRVLRLAKKEGDGLLEKLVTNPMPSFGSGPALWGWWDCADLFAEWLYQGGEGTRREAFLEYARRTLRGQGSSKLFTEVVGEPKGALQAEFLASLAAR